MAHPMYPPCQQSVLRGMENCVHSCARLSPISLNVIPNQGQSFLPCATSLQFAGPTTAANLTTLSYPYISRGPCILQHMSVADQYGGFCLNARGGRPRKDFWAAEVAKPFMVLIVKPCVKLIFSLFSLPNRASASEIILSSKEAGAAPTYLRGRRMNDWTKIVYIKYPTNGKQTGVIRQTQGGETQRRKCCTMTRRAR